MDIGTYIRRATVTIVAVNAGEAVPEGTIIAVDSATNKELYATAIFEWVPA